MAKSDRSPLESAGCSFDLFRDVAKPKRTLAEHGPADAEAQRRIAELDAVFDSMAEALLVCDERGAIVRSNSAFERTFAGAASGAQLPLDERLRALHIETAEGEGLFGEGSPSARALRGETMRGLSVKVRLQDGRDLLALGKLRAHPQERRHRRCRGQLRGCAGAQVGGAGAARKRAEFDFALDASGAGYWEYSADSSIARLSPAVARILGCEPEEIPKYPERLSWLRERIHPDDRTHVMDLMEEYRSGRQPSFGAVYRVRARDDQWRHIRMAEAALQRDAQGRPCHVAGLVFDVDDPKRSELEDDRRRSEREDDHRRSERERQEQAPGEADQRKDEFLAMLSHELRNPLAPIKNSLYVLERAEPGTAHAKRALAVIERQVGHLVRLVDDPLDLSRITRGTIQLQREPLELIGLVRRASDDYRSLFVQAGVELVVDARPARCTSRATRRALLR